MQRSLSLSDVSDEKLEIYREFIIVYTPLKDHEKYQVESDYDDDVCEISSVGHIYAYNHGIWEIRSESVFLTEKTAATIAAAVRNRSISNQNTFHEIAKYYTITKLMLLREIATQYLSSDIFITLFDVTE